MKMGTIGWAAVTSIGLLVLSCATSGTAQVMEQPNSKMLEEYKPVGETANCIDLSELRLNRRRIIDDHMIFFEGHRNRAYLNILDGKCPFLAAYGQFQINTPAGRLCNTDTITVLQRQTGAGVQCGLGHFEIYIRKDREE